jgi:hypothetical protein
MTLLYIGMFTWNSIEVQRSHYAILKAILLRPSYAEAHFLLGTVLEIQGKGKSNDSARKSQSTF